ncbi:MAG: SLC13 family permease [Candidatus Njordarchaeales archaeon]
MNLEQILVIAIFIVIMISISLEILDKAILVLLGSLFVYLVLYMFEGIMFADLFDFVDFSVISILIGIMIIVEIVKESGFFQFLALKAVKITRGNPDLLIYMISLITFLTGVFILNVASIAILLTVTVTITFALKLETRPFIILETKIVDMGAMSLYLASVPNILISTLGGVDLTFFLVNILPFSMLALWFSIVYFSKHFGEMPEVDITRKMALIELDEWTLIKDIKAFYASAIAIAAIIIGFTLYPDKAFIVILCAIGLILIVDIDFKKILKNIDWGTIFFFTGLFILVGSLEHVGILEILGHLLSNFIGKNILLGLLVILWIVAFLSGIIDNIALTLIFIPIIKSLIKIFPSGAYLFWVALVIGTNVGGEATPVGSPTAIIAMGFSEQYDIEIKFKEFLKISLIWSIGNLTLATAYILYLLYLSPTITVLPFYFLSVSILIITLYEGLFAEIKGKPKISDIIRKIKLKLQTKDRKKQPLTA